MVKGTSMPRPRFQNLAEEKRLTLLEVAANEFVQYGYEQASINRILEAGGMSKGAAYYYFDDKADVFVTTVRHYTMDILNEINERLLTSTRDNFWERLAGLYQDFVPIGDKDSWELGAIRVLYELAENSRTIPQINDLFREINQSIEALVLHGQSIGVVRTDLPVSLLIQLILGFDSGMDTWMMEHIHTYSPEEQQHILITLAKTLRSFLETPQ
jgi:AcrR family transcriptional regulator